VLRTFALALRESEKWDQSPIIGPAVFLNAPGKEGLVEATRELVTIADTEEHEGKKQAWTGIIEGELSRAREIQKEAVGLPFREIEQAVMATFLHSQPIGQSVKTRDLALLLGPTRPDKIELEKGLKRWAQVSHWLDDRFTGVGENELPTTWRLGNRPNLIQMHNVAASRISDDIVRARLLDEIGKVRSLVTGASAVGVKVHNLPARPRDVEDEGQFHYAVLGPSAASDSGKPSPEARRFLDETTGSDKPRVYRNAVLLLTPSHDGVHVASLRVREQLAWEQVFSELKEQEKEGDLDPARMQSLTINMQKARQRVPDSIRQAYCIVVTVSDKDEAQAFKINVTEDSHFSIVKNDQRSRVQDSAITAEALLPDGPYDLWREGEKSRRVKDLSGAFAQLPHLPKMLQARAILDTLVDGCEQGAFVLRLTRPDGSFRTWWFSRPDENALADPALELVLSESAELAEVSPELLVKGKLPCLWPNDEITVCSVTDYFNGSKVVQIQRNGYQEPRHIPKAGQEVVEAAVCKAVSAGRLWLTNGPASILAEEIPSGVLTPEAKLQMPPSTPPAAEVLPENLPGGWRNGKASAFSIGAALSQKLGQTLPWKTVKDVISAAINARWLELDQDSAAWPCEYANAQAVKLKVAAGVGTGTGGTGGVGGAGVPSKSLVAAAVFEPSQIQDLGDIIPQLLEIKTKSNIPLQFRVQITFGDGKQVPSEEVTKEINRLLEDLKDGFKLQ